MKKFVKSFWKMRMRFRVTLNVHKITRIEYNLF